MRRTLYGGHRIRRKQQQQRATHCVPSVALHAGFFNSHTRLSGRHYCHTLPIEKWRPRKAQKCVQGHAVRNDSLTLKSGIDLCPRDFHGYDKRNVCKEQT